MIHQGGDVNTAVSLSYTENSRSCTEKLREVEMTEPLVELTAADNYALTRPATSRQLASPRVPAVPTVHISPPQKPDKQSMPLGILRGAARRWKMVLGLGLLVAMALGPAACCSGT